ncbi:MAG: glycosyltransferase family 2 protein [Ferruginibacter sp.]
MPTYNRPDGLQKCLECIAAQTYKNLEIIISDNCSTDERVQQIILSFAAKDSRVTQTRQPVNLGLEENFNFVYSKSTAGYFIWMSDDDYFDSNYVEACVHFLENNPDHVLCSGVAKYYSGSDFLFDEKMFAVDKPDAFKRVFTYYSKVGKNGNFYGVFRNNLLHDKPVGEYVGCDWSFMGKMAILGKLSFVTTTSYHRSADGNSGTRKKMVNKFRLNKFKALFFETYTAYTVASHIFDDKAVIATFSPVARFFVTAIVFMQINLKLFVHFVKNRILSKSTGK